MLKNLFYKLVILSNVVPEPDIIVFANNYKKTISFLSMTLIIIFFLSIFVGLFIYAYINSLKAKIKELEKNKEEQTNNIKTEEEHE